MTPAETPELARVHDLLVRRATEGLDPTGERELGRSVHVHPEMDTNLYERAAAATHLALMPPPREPLPEALRKRIEASIAALAAGEEDSVRERTATAQSDSARVAVQTNTVERAPNGPRPTYPRQIFLAWTLAAAGLLLACFAWLSGSPAAPSAGPDGDVASLEGTREYAWQSGPSPRGGSVQGRVVWNEDLDAGYMVFDSFQSLAGNDPKAEQYQLWIFDSERPEGTPVDGGVFDLPDGSTPWRVTIDPKLPVTDATLFAVTIERPGGVVVSEREHIVAVAQL